VLLDLASEQYFGLDSVGTRIWTLLNEGVGAAAVVDTLLEEYEVERATLAADVDELLARLAAAGLIRFVDEAGLSLAATAAPVPAARPRTPASVSGSLVGTGVGTLTLCFTSFKQLVEELTLHRGRSAARPGPEALGAVQRIGWAVRAAARYAPWQSTCLVQVLAAQRMLQKRLLPGVFYIGAATGEAAGTGVNAGLDAHAWLKCGDQFVTGEAGHERYTVVSAFSWV
jgi:hypothetical protein